MKTRIFKDKWQKLAVIAIIAVLLPIIIIAYELITSDKNSIVFPEDFNPIVVVLIIACYLLLLILGIIWLIRQIVSILNLKNEIRKAELLHLKNQVNPHFFFNMLNNLYGLVGKDTKKAQELILNLSDMMRYSIYEGEKDSVDLREEVDYMQKYIDLHKMRYHKTIDVQFDHQLEGQHEVMPLLFLILLENAFKHGVETLRENAYVRANLTARNDEIHFEIENNFNPEIQRKAGLGLKNLKRRLELAYPKRHNLYLSNTLNSFKAQLTLQTV